MTTTGVELVEVFKYIRSIIFENLRYALRMKHTNGSHILYEYEADHSIGGFKVDEIINGFCTGPKWRGLDRDFRMILEDVEETAGRDYTVEVKKKETRTGRTFIKVFLLRTLTVGWGIIEQDEFEQILKERQAKERARDYAREYAREYARGRERDDMREREREHGPAKRPYRDYTGEHPHAAITRVQVYHPYPAYQPAPQQTYPQYSGGHARNSNEIFDLIRNFAQ